MSDLIERQAAIDKCQHRLYESALNNIGYECKADEVFSDIAQNRIQTWLEEVPSAQPNSKEMNSTRKALDTISRQAAIANYQHVCITVKCGDCPFRIEDGEFTDCRLERFLHELPSAQHDVVEVVRCRECKHGRPYKHTKEYVSCEVDCEPIDRDSDFFCADGKRRLCE